MFRIIAPIALVIAAIALFFTQTSPILDEMKTYRETQAARQKVLDIIGQYQEQLKTKKIEFNKLDPFSVDSMNRLLPDSIDNVKLIIDINQIAATRGMTIRNISIKGNENNLAIGPDTRSFGVATLGFSVTAPYKIFKDFVGDLEKSLRLIDVTALSFSSGDKDQYEFNLEIKSYWLKQ